MNSNNNNRLEEDFLIIEYNEDNTLRINRLERLNNLKIIPDEYFDFLEDLAVSDQNLNVKALATRILIEKFYIKSEFLINWIFESETSPTIIFQAIDSLSKINEKRLKTLLINNITLKINPSKNKIIESYNKELRKYFTENPLDSENIEDLKNIYINYSFIVHSERKYQFSENPNSSTLDFKLEKGFITELRIWGLNLLKTSEIDGLGFLTSLRLLDLSGNNLKEIEGLNSLQKLEILKFGDLNYDIGNQIIEIKEIQELYGLRILNLSHNYIKEIKGINNLKSLERLYLVDNSIKKIQGLFGLQNLKYLNLEKNIITKIEKLNNLNQLEKLVLSENSISVIENLEQLNELKELRINSNPISKIKPLKNPNLIIYLYRSEIEEMEWLNSIEFVRIRNIDKEKPSEYSSRYLQ